MPRLFAILVAILLAVPRGTARAQDAAPAQPELIAPGVAEPNMPPPPDPRSPAWGNYGQPEPVPSRLPPVEYQLVGPPRGWIQPNSGTEYRTVVTNPDTVPNNDLPLTQTINLNRPDGLAPAGVQGAVTLPAGRALGTYGFALNMQQGLLAGVHSVSNSSVLGSYAFAPRRGYQDSQIATIAYGVTDDLTITGSLPFQHNQIDYSAAGGGGLNTAFTNPGDIRMSFLYALRRSGCNQWHANLGMSFPVGLLETLHDMPSASTPNLPYDLRTSSGTFDALPGLTYRGQTDRWSWGVQALGTVRLGFNTLGYKMGDRVDGTWWLARRWLPALSTSVRMDNHLWFNGAGGDNRLNPALAPTNQIDLLGGRRIDMLLGMNYYVPSTRVPGQYLTIEGGAPVYQWLDGPQLRTTWMLNAGYTIAW